ncbi:hypothetical protein GCM10020220_045580 [Nonomuraea rubra]
MRRVPAAILISIAVTAAVAILVNSVNTIHPSDLGVVAPRMTE